jgi:hypothetical protein
MMRKMETTLVTGNSGPVQILLVNPVTHRGRQDCRNLLDEWNRAMTSEDDFKKRTKRTVSPPGIQNW